LPLDALIQKVIGYDPQADVDLIKRCFEFAQSAHTQQYRLSGDFYIEHPLRVANILADLSLDVPAIAAALLHDVVEDTLVRPLQIRATFGEEIYQLVEGATKLSKISFKSREEQQAENLQKMFLAMAKDIRVVMIKFADRLDNMRTLDFLPSNRQKEMAQETLEIFAPLAHRLGISQVKWELEDLAFRYKEPEKYYELARMVAEKRKEREKEVKEMIAILERKFQSAAMKAEISGRPKHLYSIYQKMQKLNKDFSEIYDLTALRVIVNSPQNCYKALGLIHTFWKPVPGTFDDYIAMPKSNMYQSLHTTVIGPGGEPVEIQIRGFDMHKVAEYGIAAHWHYKEGSRADQGFDQKVSFLRQVLDWQKEFPDAREFMDTLKADLFEEEVFTFTPQGDLIELPTGSTPLDFAYRIHTDVGHRCQGAKINNRIVPLNYKLVNGDIVEILTAKGEARPTWDWLNFVKTSQAKYKIRHWLKEQKREESIQEGRELLEREAGRRGLEKGLLGDPWIAKIAEKLGFKTNDDLLAALGYGDVNSQNVINQLKEMIEEEKVSPEIPPVEEIVLKRRLIRAGWGITVEGLSGASVRFSKCCSPCPGDNIVGYITKGREVAIHRVDCPNALYLGEEEEQKVLVEWDKSKNIFSPAEVVVKSRDRVGLLSEVTAAVSENKINLSSVKMKTYDGRATINLVLEVNSTSLLYEIIEKIKKVKGVIKVRRVMTRPTAEGRAST